MERPAPDSAPDTPDEPDEPQEPSPEPQEPDQPEPEVVVRVVVDPQRSER